MGANAAVWCVSGVAGRGGRSGVGLETLQQRTICQAVRKQIESETRNLKCGAEQLLVLRCEATRDEHLLRCLDDKL